MNFFITISKFLNITRKIILSEDDFQNSIYKKPIYFLNKTEAKNILSVKQFLEHSKEECYQFEGNGFSPDTYTYVNERDRFAKYHEDSACQGLLASFKDIAIPIEIKYKSGSKVLDMERVTIFRNWMKEQEIKELYKNNHGKFLDRLQLKFELVNRPQEVEEENKGIQSITNLSEQEIEFKIDAFIMQARNLYKTSSKAKCILVTHNFSKRTYLVSSRKYKDAAIEDNQTGYSDEEVRDVLEYFHKNIKQPIIDLLVAYWIIKLNPSLNFNKNILEQLDFKPCKFCC